MPWKVYFREHENGAISERLATVSATEAEAHFRKLLARDDLEGQKLAAVLSSPITGAKIYFSRFDMPFGRGRIHAKAPLDMFRDDDEAT
jgi:hypothetical protein